MISKTYEWYRIVSPAPRMEAVEARTEAAKELTASVSEQGPENLLALAQGVAREFDHSPAETKTVEWLLRTLKNHDPAVSENLSENELEIRCIAAITLGEFLSQSKEDPEEQAAAAAAAFVSAMSMGTLPSERYLRTIVAELSGLAFGIIQTAADARRKRVGLKKLRDEELAAPDIATAQKLISRLQTQVAGLDRNAVIDREEISLFWLMATGFSKTKKKAFSGLSVSVAAVHAALELHRSALVPAPLNCFEILGSIVERKREAEDLRPIPLEDHVARWTTEELDAIAGDGSREADLSSKFPAVFPVTWVANRMREGQCSPNWTEFSKKTRLQENVDISPVQLAQQLLRERTTVSLVEGLFE